MGRRRRERTWQEEMEQALKSEVAPEGLAGMTSYFGMSGIRSLVQDPENLATVAEMICRVYKKRASDLAGHWEANPDPHFQNLAAAMRERIAKTPIKRRKRRESHAS